MNNKCPHCGNRITTWKKWQLTDNKFGRRCPHCGNIIVLPVWYVRMIQLGNIGLAVILVLVSKNVGIDRTLFLAIGAVALILLNILMLNIVSIKKSEEPNG